MPHDTRILERKLKAIRTALTKVSSDADYARLIRI